MLTAAASEIPLPGAAPECVGVAWWSAILGGRVAGAQAIRGTGPLEE
jgi:hypothetical protein